MADQVRHEYHGSGCRVCQALRESVALGRADLVYHCSSHGPFLDRAHSSGGCPSCNWDTPLGRLVREVLGEQPATDGYGRQQV